MDSQTAPKPIRKIGVLRHDQAYSETPRVFVDAQQLDEWVACGWARRVGRNKYQLKRPDPLKLDDMSAKMGPRAILAIAFGSGYAKSLLGAWA